MKLSLFCSLLLATLTLSAGTISPGGGTIAGGGITSSGGSSQVEVKVPILTSNTSADLGQAFASSISSASFAAWKAFDGDAITYWSPSGAATNEYCGYFFSNAVIVTSYSVEMVAQKSWTFEGATTIGGTYTALHQVTAASGTFVFTNAVPYGAYRLRFSDPSIGIKVCQLYGPVAGNGSSYTLPSYVVTNNGSAILTNLTGSFVLAGSNLPPSVVTNLNYLDLVKDFGGVNDGVIIAKMTISGTLLTATLANGMVGNKLLYTNAPFKVSDVGKTIMLYEAGDFSNGGTNRLCFTTTIAGFVSSTNITLTTAPNTNSSPWGMFGTSNDNAIQSALNQITNSSIACYVPDGLYLITGNTKGTNNSQLILPEVSTSVSLPFYSLARVFKFTGSSRGKVVQAIGSTPYVPNVTTAMFWSTVTNLNGGSVIDCRNNTSPVYASQINFNSPRVEVQNMIWGGAWDNNGTVLNLAGASTARVDDSLIWSGYQIYNTPFPLSTNTIGLQMPPPSSAGGNDLARMEIIGFNAGLYPGEHANFFGVMLADCRIGMHFGKYYAFNSDGSPHISSISSNDITHIVTTNYAAYDGGGHSGFYYGMDFENVGIHLYNLPGDYSCINMTSTSENILNSRWAYPYYTNVFDPLSGLYGTITHRSSPTEPPVTAFGQIPHLQIIALNLLGKPTHSFINTPDGSVTNLTTTAIKMPAAQVNFAMEMSAADGNQQAAFIYKDSSNNGIWSVGQSVFSAGTKNYEMRGYLTPWAFTRAIFSFDATTGNATYATNITTYGSLMAAGTLTATNAVLGTITLAGYTNSAPTNASNPVIWMSVTNSGVSYRVPLYK